MRNNEAEKVLLVTTETIPNHMIAEVQGFTAISTSTNIYTAISDEDKMAEWRQIVARHFKAAVLAKGGNAGIGVQLREEHITRTYVPDSSSGAGYVREHTRNYPAVRFTMQGTSVTMVPLVP